MKTCPRCEKTYPDSELFCEDDGAALEQSGASAGRETTVMEPADAAPTQESGQRECPVCGGKAEPGEEICNFCGTRLTQEPAQPARAPQSSAAAGSEVRPETFRPAADHFGPSEMGAEELPAASEEFEEPSGSRRVFGLVGFSIAAVIALAAGAWFALYLSRSHPAAPVAQISPAASPAAPIGPQVQLARNIPLQVIGAAASAPERSHNTLVQTFEGNKNALLDAYTRALAGDPSLRDGMSVRLHVMPDGSVDSASVRVSTSPNPSLDADVVKAVTGWKFAPVNAGPVDIDYPIMFVSDPADIAKVQADLSTRLATFSPSETPEYASVPAASPAAAPSPAAALSPEVAATPVETPPATRKLSSVKPRPPPVPKPSLRERVDSDLHSNRKFRRVQIYTIGSDVTLSGRVFDDNDKLLAERIARNVAGVGHVTNNLTTDTGVWAQNQARIQQQLQNAGLTGVTVKVIGNDAYLDGEVQTDLDRQRAVTIAQSAAPVSVRTNLIRVAPGKVFGF
jgi:TonB family protein